MSEEKSFDSLSGERVKDGGKEVEVRWKRDKSENEVLSGIWSKAMALRGLKKVVSVSLEAAKVKTTGEDGEIIDIKFNPSAANAATKAIETANKMLGYNLPEEEDDGADKEIKIVFEDGEEYSD